MPRTWMWVNGGGRVSRLSTHVSNRCEDGNKRRRRHHYYCLQYSVTHYSLHFVRPAKPHVYQIHGSSKLIYIYVCVCVCVCTCIPKRGTSRVEAGLMLPVTNASLTDKIV